MKKLLLLLLLLLPSVLFAEERFTKDVADTIDIYLPDSTTGLGKTGLTVTGITCDLAKHSLTSTATKTTFTCAASGSSNDCVEIAHGLYNVELSAGNLDTLGNGKLVCQCSGTLGSKNSIEVVAAASYAVNISGDISDNDTLAAAVKALLDTAYASLWGNTDVPSSGIQADTDDIQTRLPSALVGGKMDSTASGGAGTSLTTGTAQAGSATTITLAAADPATYDQEYRNAYIYLSGGTGAPQWGVITDFVNSTKVATVTVMSPTRTFQVVPDGTSTYVILPIRGN